MPLGYTKNQSTDLPAAGVITLAAETVIGTIAGISTTPEGDQVVIEGVANILAGTTTTAVVLRLRRTNLAGAQVGLSATHTLAAGASASIPFQWQDVPAETVSGQYVLTAQQTGGTGNGTVNQGNIQATW